VLTKAKCSFALDRDLLLGLSSIDFQVKVPPSISISPAEDFALLMVQLYVPREPGMSEAEYLAVTLKDKQFIAKCCKPIKVTTSAYGNIVDGTMTGTFLLDLENNFNRDTFILRFIIFGAIFGIDNRFGMHQRYTLHIPLLSDPVQLKHKPAIVKTILDEIKLNRDFLDLQAAKPRRARTNSASSCSESENEDAFKNATPNALMLYYSSLLFPVMLLIWIIPCCPVFLSFTFLIL